MCVEGKPEKALEGILPHTSLVVHFFPAFTMQGIVSWIEVLNSM